MQPQSQTAALNARVKFQVVADESNAVSYHWLKNGLEIAGAITEVLKIASVKASDAGDYKVIVKNSGGETVSAIATLTVNTSIVAPTITLQPQSQTVTQGARATFTTKATGTEPIQVIWTVGLNSLPISLTPPSSGDTYTFTSAQPNHSGVYRVMAKNAGGTVISSPFALTVTPQVPSAPSIVVQPQHQTVSVGSTAVFTFITTGATPTTYRWVKEGEPERVGFGNGSQHTFSPVRLSDAGNYFAVVETPSGSALSAPFTLTVLPVVTTPTITSQPENQTVMSGGSVRFSVTASGPTPFTYQWSRTVQGITTDIPGATFSTYSIGLAQATDAGGYSVVVRNSNGSVVSATAMLIIDPAQPPPGTGWVPNPANRHYYKFIEAANWKDAQTAAVALGANLATVRNSAENTWISTIFGDVLAWIGLTDEAKEGTWRWISGEPVSFTKWQPGEPNNAGSLGAENYAVINWNVPGGWNDVSLLDRTISVGLIEWVPPNPAAPTITLQPQSQTVAAGTAATLSVTASGPGPLTYQWRKDDVDISGAASSIYTLASAQAAHAGSYRVVVSNSAGSVVSAVATLVVTPIALPAILVSPQGQTVTAGTTVTFSVVASGTAPLFYQWRKDGVEISGATVAAYTIASVQSANAGSYSVVVSNAAGSLISSAGMLAIAASSYEYTFSTWAGSAGISGSADGLATARFNNPIGLAVDVAGNVYVGDRQNHTIRKIAPDRTVVTLAGSKGVSGSSDGAGASARFSQPLGLAVDTEGNVFVADSGNSTIRKITPNGVVSTFAGTAGSLGGVNGIGSAARFRAPYGVALDSSGNLYVADGDNHSIRKITPGGTVSTLAGSLGTGGSANGTGNTARLNHPEGLTVDGAGNVFVADTWNHTIRKVTPWGVVTTLAGSAGSPGSANGTGASARFYFPTGVAVDNAGTILVADQFNHTLRKITPAGVATTLAGATGQSGSANGAMTAARFNQPIGLCFDAGGNLYVADYANHTIRKGTSAAPAAPRLAIQWIGQLLQLTMPAVNGRTFKLQSTTDLLLGSWVDVPNAVLTGSAPLNLSLPISQQNAAAFYRAVVAP